MVALKLHQKKTVVIAIKKVVEKEILQLQEMEIILIMQLLKIVRFL